MMDNFSDGKSDGLMLMYVKDGKVYPVGLVKSELEMLDIIITTAITRVVPLFDKCMGDVQEIKF